MKELEETVEELEEQLHHIFLGKPFFNIRYIQKLRLMYLMQVILKKTNNYKLLMKNYIKNNSNYLKILVKKDYLFQLEDLMIKAIKILGL